MKTRKKADLSYRADDGMFTVFYPNTPEGEQAWKIIAAQNDGTGKVPHQHVKSTIQQLRDNGYTVTKAASRPSSKDPIAEADELLKELGITI